MSTALEVLAMKARVRFLDYQRDALLAAEAMPGPQQRLCLYYKTGAGKSLTALASLALWGHTEALVITPPATFAQWYRFAEQFGIMLEAMSHAKFRMASTKVSKTKAIIADEMHLFGGHGGQGWAKLDKVALHLQAPMILSSATPNYNDAERVYCIQHILDPHSCKGGYLEFLYAHCITRQNQFAMMPDVEGFKNFPDAASYLAALPGVQYLPDDTAVRIVDVPVKATVNPEMDEFGYDRRRHRMLGSGMEEKHARIFQSFVDEHGVIHRDIYEELMQLVEKATTPVLVYADHATIAEALALTLAKDHEIHGLVTGKTKPKDKATMIHRFNTGSIPVLVGTATLATGTDGMSKVCDTLVILDDTQDDSLRRQLIGRILPRGLDIDASQKRVFRMVPQ